MTLKTRIATGLLLSFTVLSSALPIATKAEAKGFSDLHHEKIEALKLAKLKKEKKHHLHKSHHGHSFGRRRRSFPRRFRRSRRSRHSFGHSKFFFKHH